MQTKTKFKLVRYAVGIIAAVIWYLCKDKGGNPVVQEVAGIIAVLALFRRLIWKFLFHSTKTDASASSSTQTNPSSTSEVKRMSPPKPNVGLGGGGPAGMIPFPFMEKNFYNRYGKHILVLKGDSFYSIDGTPWAFIAKDGGIYSSQRQEQIGWWKDNWVIGLDACYAFYCDASKVGPAQPANQPVMPHSALKAPIRYLTPATPTCPPLSISWSSMQ